MTGFVLDASVAIAWCFADESSGPSRQLLESLQFRAAVVPPLWNWEIGNALLTAERRGRIEPAAADLFLRLLRQLPIHVDAGSADRALEETRRLAREHDLTTYDASYLELAHRRGLPLATRDAALARAAAAVQVSLLSA
ncbi:MAG TPA: type II toxin-antitoxin system VapC family toxin [Steroidobacteraceae bacterium]|nr:type II toxin-antitoxin system VapC family toxin [Steroidobacteraceae bacterium]